MIRLRNELRLTENQRSKKAEISSLPGVTSLRPAVAGLRRGKKVTRSQAKGESLAKSGHRPGASCDLSKDECCKNLFSLGLRDPKQRNETIHGVVGDEGGPLIVTGNRAFVFERILCKRRSGGRLLQESWPIDVQAFRA